MRLIGTYSNPKEALDHSLYLKSLHIENQVDMEKNDNWGSENYSDVTAKLWVIDEDQVATAIEKIEEFKKNPIPIVLPPEELEENEEQTPEYKDVTTKEPLRLGKITSYLVIICSCFLFLNYFSETSNNISQNKIPQTLIGTPPLNKALMYDYPESLSLINNIIRTYGIESLENEAEMPLEEKIAIKKYINTPIWNGFYPLLINKLKNGSSISIQAPLFEKIKEGQVWRLFTPILLHNDLIHLIFNMLWLIVAGKQLEGHLGKLRYLLFILIVAVISNTTQYLVSGYNFVGFSGVLCGMIGFIWARKKVAPSETYDFDSSTIRFITLFIVAMLGLQMISSIVEIYSKSSLPFGIGIANAAHISGGITGVLLGFTSLFAIKENP